MTLLVYCVTMDVTDGRRAEAAGGGTRTPLGAPRLFYAQLCLADRSNCVSATLLLGLTWLQVDRSTMGLFYSGNGVDWHTAGIVDYHMCAILMSLLIHVSLWHLLAAFHT